MFLYVCRQPGQQGEKAPKTFSRHSEIAKGLFTGVDLVP